MKELTPEIDGQVYSSGYGRTPMMMFFGRNEDDEKEVWYSNKIKPYFYVDDRRGGTLRERSTIRKVVVEDLTKVRKLRKQFKHTYEGDIPFDRRILIDVLEDELFIEPRVVYFDIEADRKDNIIALSAMTNDGREMYCASKEKEILSEFDSFIVGYDIITSWSEWDYKILQRKNFSIPMSIEYLDLLTMFRKIWTDPISNFKLSTVAKLVDSEKIDLGPRHPEDLSKEELEEYNRRDTEIIKLLDEKFEIMFYFTYLASIGRCLIKDTLSSSTFDDIILLRSFNRSGYVLRTCKWRNNGGKYEGAYVYANPGRYENVAIWDFTALYPTIIIASNISLETFDASGDILLENGIRFKSKPFGIIPKILKELISERMILKKKYKETGDRRYYIQQEALKTSVINAIYGQFGFVNSRIYNRTIAESITSIGRSVIQYLKSGLEDRGFNIVYADTDSVFVSDDPDKKSGLFIDDILNDYVSEFNFVDKFRVEFKGLWEKVFIKTKKQYVLFNEPDKYVIKGMGIVRGDTSNLQKDIEFDVIKGLLNGLKKREIAANVSRQLAMIKEHPLHYIAFPRKIRLDKAYRVKTQAARALEYTHRYIGETEYEDLGMLVYVKSCPSGVPYTDILALPKDLSKLDGYKIDYDKTCERSISRVKDLITLSLDDFEFMEDM